MNPEENSGAMNFFGVDVAKTPCVLVHDPSNDGKYNSGVIEPSKIKKFVEDFKAGKIERTIKSEDEPASNDGPVKIVTAKSLKNVADGKKNVLIGARSACQTSVLIAWVDAVSRKSCCVPTGH